MRLPDPDRSNVVLLGTSRYYDPDLHDLPGVRDNVQDLRTLLTDRRYGIVAPDRCIPVLEPVGYRELFGTLRAQAQAATDTLVVYYAGHGLLNDNASLYLAMRDTGKTDLAVSALPFQLIREVMLDSTATSKVLILDCCFSGRAIDGMGADTIVVEGSYVLTASAATQEARAPKGATYTAFTGELIRLLREGVAGGPALLSVHDLYLRLRHALRARDFPDPQSQATRTAQGIVLARNRWTRPKPASAAPTGSAPTPPGPAKPASTGPTATRPVRVRTGVAKPAAPAPAAPTSTRPAPARTVVAKTVSSAPGRGAARAEPAVGESVPRAAETRPGGSKAVPHHVPRKAPGPAGPGAKTPKLPAAKPTGGATKGKATSRYVPLPRLAFCQQGATLITSGRDRLIRIWDVAGRRVRHTLTGHNGAVTRYAIGATCGLLATAGQDRSIRLWNIDGGQQVARIDAAARWLAFHPFKPLLACVGDEPTVEIRSVRTGQPVQVLRGHTRDILRVSFSPDGTEVLTSSRDGTLRVWDARGGAQRIVLDGVRSPRQVAFHVAAGWVATGLASGGVRLRSLASGAWLADLPGADCPTELLASRDGRTLATLDGAGGVQLWEVRTRRTLLTLVADRAQPATRLLFGPGRTIATLADTGVTRLWDIRTGKVTRTLRDGCRAPHWLTFDPDGHYAAIGSRDYTVHLYDLRNTRPPRQLRPEQDWPDRPGRATSAWADAVLRSAYDRLWIDVGDRI